jgi:Uma2 family endonuclease
LRFQTVRNYLIAYAPAAKPLVILAVIDGRRNPAMVLCSKVSPRDTATSEPVVVFEILSPGSGSNDLGVKNAEYQTLAFLRRYVVLHQSLAAAEVFAKREDGEWGYEFLTGEHALEMPESGNDLPIQEIYEGVELAG